MTIRLHHNVTHCLPSAPSGLIHSQHFLHQLLLVYLLLYFLPLLLSVSLLLSPEEDKMSKALVHYCFPVFRRIGEYILLDLFYILHQ